MIYDTKNKKKYFNIGGPAVIGTYGNHSINLLFPLNDEYYIEEMFNKNPRDLYYAALNNSVNYIPVDGSYYGEMAPVYTYHLVNAMVKLITYKFDDKHMEVMITFDKYHISIGDTKMRSIVRSYNLYGLLYEDAVNPL
jgi:hypothetical protein